ncbi:hypothetical protein yc1106_02126 [Curvularia clavata]|uniref:Uncharacterized protein n=1 Tax=Curvularia clavata TaxID=95742 RepID=A0A9Q8Z345_CURCL|nr:hypothetical protein yc1106_02126 [Curvularia clavata]
MCVGHLVDLMNADGKIKVRFVDDAIIEDEAELATTSDDETSTIEKEVDDTYEPGNLGGAPGLDPHQPNSLQTLQRTGPHSVESIVDTDSTPMQDTLNSSTSSIENAIAEDLSHAHVSPQFERTHSTNLLQVSVNWSGGPPSDTHNLPSLPGASPHDLDHTSSFSGIAFSPNPGRTVSWPVDNAYEARLLHHFIVHCTKWVDVCDGRHSFEKEVPKRAAHFPVIRDGLFGLAARHLWILGKEKEDLSQLYIDRCLKTLILALENPLAHWDENFLVAVILLRLHEEIGDGDTFCHHFGSARILNSISSFAADGGLRESASWVSLRQHIYVSLTTQQPLNLSLDNYKHSSAFHDYEDESWANRIIFQFATILQNVFEGDVNSNFLTREKWNELDADTETWFHTKPWHFVPLHSDPEAGTKFQGSWPSLPTAQGVIAVALQYYHLCKIILTIYSSNASLVGLAGVRARKATDAAIRRHIRIIIGYGISNKHCYNAMFQGSHILSACGAYITDRDEQNACVEYLKSLQALIGWRTDKVILDLQEQWEYV